MMVEADALSLRDAGDARALEGDGGVDVVAEGVEEAAGAVGVAGGVGAGAEDGDGWHGGSGSEDLSRISPTVPPARLKA